MTILVTGAAGFIGSNFVLDWIARGDEPVVGIDALTYAGNLDNLVTVDANPRWHLVVGDIVDRALVRATIERARPRAIVHFAAESHVDRSIADPSAFARTNVLGTLTLLDEARLAFASGALPSSFRFAHVSTDEVFGSLGPGDAPFREETAFAPNSPYSASKAAADHFVRAYWETHRLPTVTTHCSNNYGPRQFPEKLMPLIIARALAARPIPIYGDGLNVRDWLYVADHNRALARVLEAAPPGATYNIGGNAERTNLDVACALCRVLDARRPRGDGRRHEDLITFVKDRPGHDRRYAVDASRLRIELGWAPRESFGSGLEKTVDWYLANDAWLARAAA